MDAKQLGKFIAERRKELGLTQALLAEKLHVTDKAISRWERGIGLPDIHSIEALADALNVSLIELIRAQRNENDNISTKEAEKLLVDTIQLSKTTNKYLKNAGIIILGIFLIIALVLLGLLISDGTTVMFSVGSIISGLIAWGIPVWQISIAKTSRIIPSTTFSFGFSLTAMMIQFLDIAREIHSGDMAAVEDTIALILVVVLFVIITIILNMFMSMIAKYKN